MTEPLRILLVEDNKDHAAAIQLSFTKRQAVNSVTHLPDGEAALNFLFRREEFSDPRTSPELHVILLDLRLPKVDGLEALREIKESEEFRRIPVVVLTCSEQETDINKAYDNRANSYLVKPLDLASPSDLSQGRGFYWPVWNSR